MSIPIKSSPLKVTWHNDNDYPLQRSSVSSYSSSPFGAMLGFAQSAFNHRLAEKSAENSHARQLEFWHEQNLYNTPLAQRNRFYEAGMSPIDAVQSQPAGELSSVPQNEFAQNGTLDIFSQLEAFSHMEKLGTESDLVAQQFKIAVVEEAIKRGNLFGVKIDNAQKSILLRYLDSKERFSLSKLLSEINNLDSDTTLNTESAKSIKDKRPYEIGSIISNIEESKSRTQKNITESNWMSEILELEKNLKEAQTTQAKAVAAKAYAEARVANIKADLEEEYGADMYEAKVTDAQSAARYADSLRNKTWQLLDSMEKLNENQALTNEARVEIEQAAQDLKERIFKFEKTKYAIDSVKDVLNSAVENLDKISNFAFNYL